SRRYPKPVTIFNRLWFPRADKPRDLVCRSWKRFTSGALRLSAPLGDYRKSWAISATYARTPARCWIGFLTAAFSRSVPLDAGNGPTASRGAARTYGSCIPDVAGKSHQGHLVLGPSSD